MRTYSFLVKIIRKSFRDRLHTHHTDSKNDNMKYMYLLDDALYISSKS